LNRAPLLGSVQRTIELGGGLNSVTGSPRSASRSVCATDCTDCCERPPPTALCGLSGSAVNEAAASSGVKPTNQAVRLPSVVPVLPATGRSTISATPLAVDQPPQPPRAAPSPVTQRAASVAARAVSWLIACRQRGSATGTCSPSAFS